MRFFWLISVMSIIPKPHVPASRTYYFFVFWAEVQRKQVLSTAVNPRMYHACHSEAYQISYAHRSYRENY